MSSILTTYLLTTHFFMILMQLLDQPMFLLAWVAAIIFVLTIHEFSHALAATALGDDTAKMKGRLTLNPLSHVSWLGFFMLLMIGFGWGKPVPFNPYNLKWPRFGPAVVALAGPLSNLISAIVFIIVFKLVFPAMHPLFLIYSGFGAEGNLLAIFLSLAIFLNLILMLFNLIPLPPLDGSKVLFAILSDMKFARIREVLEDQGPFILLMIIVLDNIANLNLLGRVFYGVLDVVYKWLA